jgi:hypothetical protein
MQAISECPVRRQIQVFVYDRPGRLETYVVIEYAS